MIKTRSFPEENYRSVYHNFKTIRMYYDSSKPIVELKYPEFYDVKITNYCSGACNYCLNENSLISTIDGKKKIKDIVVGDTVLNVNAKNLEVMTNEVEQIHKREYSGELIIIELENGEILEITPNHKIFTFNRGWIRADKIKEIDDIYFLDI